MYQVKAGEVVAFAAAIVVTTIGQFLTWANLLATPFS